MSIKLDVKDRKILYQLDVNSRQSNAEIGKKVGLSKEVVNYRIKDLERKKVIESYYAITNAMKLGYIYTRYFFNFNNIPEEKFEEIVSYFRKIPNINWLGRGHGVWEFVAVALAKDIDEITALDQEINDKYGKFIRDKDVIPLSKIRIFPQNYAYLESNKNPAVIQGPDESDRIDAKDIHIFKELEKNAKISILDLSNKVKLTPKMVSMRIERLLKKGFILGFRYQLNHRLLEYDYYHIFFRLQNLTREKRAKLIEFLSSLKNIFYIDEGFGKYDIECEFLAHSYNELYGIIENIKKNFPEMIRSYDIALTYEVHKAF